MGILPSALTSKSLERVGCENVRVGAASMQGCRMSQEDAHRIELALSNHPNFQFFGVFDGHGGGEASKYVEKNLVPKLNELETFDDESLKQLFIDLDAAFCVDENAEFRENGTTCCICLVEKVGAGATSSSPSNSDSATTEAASLTMKDDAQTNGDTSASPSSLSTADANHSDEKDDTSYNVTCVNLGDSRAILLRSDQTWMALSEDHKPTNKVESDRISAAGGSVMQARVDGNLAVSRAFGDYTLKKDKSLPAEEQKVSCVPDIVRTTMRPRDLLYLSCDGLFEHLENSDVVECVQKNYDLSNPDPAKTLTVLFHRALESGSTDNMTGVLAHFVDGTDYKHGEQYIPGPLFANRKDSTFLDAYLKDAKGKVDDNVLLRILAYHQDLKDISENMKTDLLREIKRLDPFVLTIAQLATLVNGLHHEILVTSAHVETFTRLGVPNVQKLIDLLNSDDGRADSTWEENQLPTRVRDGMEALTTLWQDLPASTKSKKKKKKLKISYTEEDDEDITIDDDGDDDDDETDESDDDGEDHFLDPLTKDSEDISPFGGNPYEMLLRMAAQQNIQVQVQRGARDGGGATMDDDSEEGDESSDGNEKDVPFDALTDTSVSTVMRDDDSTEPSDTGSKMSTSDE